MFTIEDYEIVIFPSPDKEERWLYVRFPDIPEILTGGGTIEDVEDAIQNAKEAFASHMEALQKQGNKIPEPKGKLMYA
jgi:predicted RNase H-like HicB family nuclease